MADLTKLNLNVEGIDTEERCVLASREFAPVKRGSIYDLTDTYLQDDFDVVIASHVLEHLENPHKAVSMLKQISRRYLILAVPNLAEFYNLRWNAKGPGFVNPGHQVGWDAAHFNTFLTHTCGLEVQEWAGDRVYVHPLFRPILRFSGILSYVEDTLLPKQIPFQSHFLVVLCTQPSHR